MTKSRLLIPLSLFVIASFSVQGQSEIHRRTAPVTDYPASDVQYSGGYTLVKGDFYQAGSYSGSVVSLDQEHGNANTEWPVISGDVNVVVGDGSGGYFAGGSIHSVDNEDVGNLIHIHADGTLDRTFLPNPLGVVYTLQIDNNILYVGGSFVTIANQSRPYAAAFDLSNGSLTSWNPRSNNRVTSIEVTDDVIFLAGFFTQLNNGAVLRNRIAAVNKTTGDVISGWNVALEGTSVNVYALEASASRLFVGGTFARVNGTDRNCLAALSLVDGSLDASWDPQPIGSEPVVVNDLVLSGPTLYVAGFFDLGIGGLSTKKHLAAISSSGTGTAIAAFQPVFDDTDIISDIDLVGSSLFIHGYFNSVNGVTRLRLAKLDATSGVPASWNPEIQGTAYDVVASGSRVFVAGDLQGINWKAFRGVVIMEESTGNFWPHDLNLPFGEDILTMKVSGTTMYVGGSFTNINGVERKNLAAIDLESGEILPWNPGASGTTNTSFDDTKVIAMELRDDVLYIAGVFLNAGGQPRRGIAALDATTGAALAWNPGVGDGTSMNEYIVSMDLHGDNLYVAGRFVNLAGQTRPFLGALNATTGALVNWNPAVITEVRKVRIAGNAAYILGDFSDGIAGTVRHSGIAAIDLTTGLATAFDPQFNSSYTADIALTDTDIFIAGYYSVANGENRPGLASFSLASGELNPWTPDLGSAGEGNYDVASIDVSATRLYVAGGFVSVGLENRAGYAEYDLVACEAVATISLDGTTLVASDGDSYQWFHNDTVVDGANTQFFGINIFEYGKYTIEVTTNGCTARSDDYIYLVTDVEQDLGNHINFYPNPVADQLSISVPTTSTVTIVDSAGKVIFSGTFSKDGTESIDTRGWPSGCYILKVQNNKFTKASKIIKIN